MHLLVPSAQTQHEMYNTTETITLDQDQTSEPWSWSWSHPAVPYVQFSNFRDSDNYREYKVCEQSKYTKAPL